MRPSSLLSSCCVRVYPAPFHPYERLEAKHHAKPVCGTTFLLLRIRYALNSENSMVLNAGFILTGGEA